MSARKKNQGQLFFHKQLIYKISRPQHTRFKSYEAYLKAEGTDEQMNGRTSQKQYASPNSSKFGA